MKSIYKTVQSCRICNSSKITEILNFGNQAPANSLYKPTDERPSEVPLRLMFCDNCTTVQLGEDVDPNYLFSQYLWVTGTSKTAEKYSYEFAKNALDKVDILEGKEPYVVEIASNDGTFLRPFIENGCNVLGIDPAENIAKEATNNGIPTIPEFFNVNLANKLIKKHGQVDIIFARNVIPHVQNIHSVVEGISNFLKEDGVGIIEFHNVGLVLDELHYDYIYHEHLFYFSLQTINGLLNMHNLYTYDLMYSPISGGSWVVYFSKNKKSKTANLLEAEEKEFNNHLNKFSRWKEFSDSVVAHADKIKDMVFETGRKIPAYGASARSSTLLNYCGINSKHISVVIDKNPLKDGLYTAGSNIPIVSFKDGLKIIEKSNLILLLAWNFQDEIISELREAGFKGEFIIPLPGEAYKL
ncbi:class I SAM-dependent methyltransferase [Alphaproteobacteria bacterium]|nr:class I SAM-dependent methyltransferase [Alphaproteobacteria bacterium]MDC1023091.1 class I SAM-dependent methyltransferase [Alphaproteobacteria bacterium]